MTIPMAQERDELREELVKAFHLEQVPEEKRDELLGKMTEAVLKRIFLATMEKLGEDGVNEYEALLDRQATPEEVDAFFEKNIPGYDVFTQNIVSEFKEEMKKGV